MVRIQLSTAQTFCKQILLLAEALADITNALAKDEIEPPNSVIYCKLQLHLYSVVDRKLTIYPQIYHGSCYICLIENNILFSCSITEKTIHFR